MHQGLVWSGVGMHLQVPTVQKFRKGLPENASMVICKNTLMKVAVNEVQGWSALGEAACKASRSSRAPVAASMLSPPRSAVWQCAYSHAAHWGSARAGDGREKPQLSGLCARVFSRPVPSTCVAHAPTSNARWALVPQGENAWVFVPEDGIQDAVKHYFKFEEDLFTEAKKVAPKNTEVKPPTELSAVIMDGKMLTPKDLKACEKLPTKKQLLATIAGLVKQPTTRIATGIKQVPSKLAIAIKKVSELDEDKTKTVGSFAKDSA